MAGKSITVDFASGELIISPITPDPPFIADGDWLWWRFDGLPEDGIPMIHFEKALGPFESLRSYKDRWILAKGNLGTPEIYTYTAMVCVPGIKEPLAVSQSQIDNRATIVNRSPRAQVFYQPAVPPETKGTLVIHPQALQLFDGDTAIWESDDLPPASFLNVRFTGATHPTWPFVAINVALGQQGGTRQIHATGFAVQDPSTAPFDYTMELRDADGILLADTDPQIDRLPPPPDGGS